MSAGFMGLTSKQLIRDKGDLNANVCRDILKINQGKVAGLPAVPVLIQVQTWNR